MDPREPPPQPNMFMGPTSYPTNPMIQQSPSVAAAAARFSFNHLAPPPSQPESQSKHLESFNSGGLTDRLRPGRRGSLARVPSLPRSATGVGPPGSGKKQLDALGGLGGVGFTPHVISVKAGEDIASKIVAFSQQGPRTVCILSASGAICNVTLRQPAMSGGTVTYEGRFEIISLSGSFLLSDNNGNRSRSGGLSVSLAGSDGRVLGGGVAGMLMAASPVQIIVGSFIADGKKSNSNILKSGPSSAPTPHMLNFGAPMTTSSPPSQGASSESSDDHGSSPL
ncbi:AT-hook motif nuclear-localized protein, partial [Melia azedarach]